MKQDQPMWACMDCGMTYGKRQPGIASWHIDTCGVCGKTKIVTEPRDFGYLKPEGVKEKK